MSTIETRRPALDCIRILFCLMVIGEHYLTPSRPSGAVAVIGFCVMSGFWVGALMQRRSFDVMEFYSRKVKRLLPMLCIALLFGFLLSVVLYYNVTVAKVLHWNVFTHNNFSILNIFYFYDVPAWYMNCEFMFLLLVPFFYFLCQKSWWNYTAVFALLFIVAAVMYYPLAHTAPRGGGLYFHPLTRMWEFMAGVFAYRMIAWSWLRYLRPILIMGMLGVAIVSTFYFTQESSRHYADSFPFQVYAVTFYCLLLAACFPLRCSHVKLNGFLAYAANLTYGIYLFHMPVKTTLCLGLRQVGMIEREQSNEWYILCLALIVTVITVMILQKMIDKRCYNRVT